MVTFQKFRLNPNLASHWKKKTRKQSSFIFVMVFSTFLADSKYKCQRIAINLRIHYYLYCITYKYTYVWVIYFHHFVINNLKYWWNSNLIWFWVCKFFFNQQAALTTVGTKYRNQYLIVWGLWKTLQSFVDAFDILVYNF